MFIAIRGSTDFGIEAYRDTPHKKKSSTRGAAE
jgi:hypothetical protein